MSNVKPAGPMGTGPPPTPCEREIEAEKDKNARLREELKAERARRDQLEKQVAELQREPYPGPSAAPPRPF